MEFLFSKDFVLVWAVVLTLALYFPTRKLIWVLYMRRAYRKLNAEPEPAESERLRRRAGFTAFLLCLVFSVLYTNYLFQG